MGWKSSASAALPSAVRPSFPAVSSNVWRLARALVYEPEILLLDEPLSNLDAKLREQMRVEIRTLQKQLGLTVLYVTHDQAEAMTLSDRIAVVHRGRFEQVGTPEEVYEMPQTEFAAGFLGRMVSFPGKFIKNAAGCWVELAGNAADVRWRRR